MPELFERGRKFLKSIAPNEKVTIIHHRDIDGICSGALVKIALERLKIKDSMLFSGSYKDLSVILQNVKSDKTIIADIGVSSNFVRFLANPTLIIDHHMIKDDINRDDIIFINPRLINQDVYQPASYIVYKLMDGVVDLQDKEWLVVLGIAGDYAFEDCKDILRKWSNAKSRDELLEKTEIGKAAFFLTGAIFELGVEKVMEILLTTKDFHSLLENKEVRNAGNIYKRSYEKDKEKFWKKSESIGKIIFSIIRPAHEGMGSAIVNEVSRKNPNKIILLLEDLGDKYDIDARYHGSDVYLDKLMEKTCGGGGHRHAAGGLIDKNDLERFKKRVMTELGIRR